MIETWTTKILDCVHVHWRSIEENKLFIWTKDWFKFTFESFDVTSHFSALSPTNSWLPQRIYSCTELTPASGQDQRSIITLFVSWLVKCKIDVHELLTRAPHPLPPSCICSQVETFLHEARMKEECVQEYAELFVKNRLCHSYMLWYEFERKDQFEKGKE